MTVTPETAAQTYLSQAKQLAEEGARRDDVAADYVHRLTEILQGFANVVRDLPCVGASPLEGRV